MILHYATCQAWLAVFLIWHVRNMMEIICALSGSIKWKSLPNTKMKMCCSTSLWIFHFLLSSSLLIHQEIMERRWWFFSFCALKRLEPWITLTVPSCDTHGLCVNMVYDPHYTVIRSIVWNSDESGLKLAFYHLDRSWLSVWAICSFVFFFFLRQFFMIWQHYVRTFRKLLLISLWKLKRKRGCEKPAPAASRGWGQRDDHN